MSQSASALETVGSSTPPSGGEIHVRPGAMTVTPSAPAAKPAAPAQKAAPEAPAAPAEPGQPKKSAAEKMFEKLRGTAKGAPGTVEPPPSKGDAPEAGTEGDPAEAPDDDLYGSQKPEGEEQKTAEPKPGEAPKAEPAKGKANPWKLLESEKAAAAALKKQLDDTKKLLGDPEARKSELARIEAVEKRNKELEEHIRFVDYSKSEEFKVKYEKPYEDKWTQTMSDLRDVVITDPDSGSERAIQPQDILKLVNLPLNKAMEMAKEVYGDSASIIMNYRNELRNLFKAKTDALEKARTEGTEKFKRDSEAARQKSAELHSATSKHWEEANSAIIQNEATGHYFKPIDGETDLNSRLEKGYKFVDEVMAKNPFDPSLTEEQRAQIVRQHAAVRARAAAFGKMRAMLEVAKKREADLQKKLEEYEASEPTTTGTSPQNGDVGPRKAIDSVFSNLRRIAK